MMLVSSVFGLAKLVGNMIRVSLGVSFCETRWRYVSKFGTDARLPTQRLHMLVSLKYDSLFRKIRNVQGWSFDFRKEISETAKHFA